MSTEDTHGDQEAIPELISDQDAADSIQGEGLAAIADALLAGTSDRARSAWPVAQAALATVFPTSEWGISHNSNEFSPDGRGNLYRAEIPGDFKSWLRMQDIDERGYIDAITPVQFNSVQIWLKKLFYSGPRANYGWRIRLVGFPSVEVIAIGLGSHYQGTPSQNRLGRASELIRTAALNVLAGDPPLREALESYSSATSEHWDERKLMPTPIMKVGNIDIAGYQDGGARLRMIRNTTVKKDLATFFCITGMTRDTFLGDGDQHITAMRQIARRLGEEDGA